MSAGRSDLSRLLRPRGIAVVGASMDAARIGGQPLHILREFDYSGGLYPVNPKYREMHGLACYADVSQVPQPCDLALIALPGAHVAGAVRGCAAAGIAHAVVLSAGFAEAGGEGTRLQTELVAAARASGVRLVGPNCLGLINIKDGVRSGFGPSVRLRTLKPGPLAMVTQSGGVGFGLVAITADAGVGWNYAVSTGNEADLTALDFLEHFLEREDVELVCCFLEGTTEGRRLRALGQRALALGKPVLVWKVGNTEPGRRAALSHTARMTASYDLFRTAFDEGGFIEIGDVDDIVDCAKLFAPRRRPRGRRVGVVSVSGGAAVLFADRCIEQGLELPAFSDSTAAAIRRQVAPFVAVANPLDATANTNVDGASAYLEIVRSVLADPHIDQVIARAPRSRDAAAWGREFVAMAQGSDKPVVVNWPSSIADHGELLRVLETHQVPCFTAPGRAVRALAKLNTFAERELRYRVRALDAKPGAGYRRLHVSLPAHTGALGEHASKRILVACGIPVVREVLLDEAALAALSAAPLPFPVAVKVESGDLPHKTEAGAVRLGIGGVEALRQAGHQVLASARAYAPRAQIEGVLVQEMAAGQEVIVGAVDDPYFGPVVTLGFGGIHAELLRDVTRRFAPFEAATAREMIAELEGAPLLQGYRGREPLDIDALADVLARVSMLMADCAGRIQELDINPLFVRRAGEGVLAADALIVLR